MTLLIDEQDFKELAPVSENLSNYAPLPQSIYIAQELYIKPVICEDLYDELIMQKETNTLTPANITLLKRLRAALVYYALYQFQQTNYIKIREQGLVTQTGATASPPKTEDATWYRQSTIASAETFMLQFVKWLEDNSATYPLYNCGNCYKPLINTNIWFDII